MPHEFGFQVADLELAIHLGRGASERRDGEHHVRHLARHFFSKTTRSNRGAPYKVKWSSQSESPTGPKSRCLRRRPRDRDLLCRRASAFAATRSVITAGGSRARDGYVAFLHPLVRHQPSSGACRRCESPRSRSLPVGRIRADASRHRHRPRRRPPVGSAIHRPIGMTSDAGVAPARHAPDWRTSGYEEPLVVRGMTFVAGMRIEEPR